MDRGGKKSKINDKEEDLRLIEDVLKGQKKAFEYLQKKYEKIIATLIRRMIKDEDDVQDLIQETFIKAYNSLTMYKKEYSFSSWLYRIASNNCIDFLRKKKLPMISITQNVSDEEHNFDIKDEEPTPDLTIMLEERKRVLEKAMNDLPDNYREIIRLRHIEEMDYLQIAEHLKIPLGTVKAQIFRARKMLYSYLKKYRYLFY